MSVKHIADFQTSVVPVGIQSLTAGDCLIVCNMQLFITLTLLTHALASSASTLQYRTNVVQRVISVSPITLPQASPAAKQ